MPPVHQNQPIYDNQNTDANGYLIARDQDSPDSESNPLYISIRNSVNVSRSYISVEPNEGYEYMISDDHVVIDFIFYCLSILQL